MLIGLTIRDVVLIQALELEVGPGLTVLTGETGAGKSIVLDALGLALGQRADAGLVRQGSAQAQASAAFDLAPEHPAFTLLEERGLRAPANEPLVLRRQVSADGRSRAFINDQAVSAGVLRDVGALLIEVHGQHETVGLLDPRRHRPMLDAFGDAAPAARAVAEAWRGVGAARLTRDALAERASRSAAETEEQAARLADLDRLDPRAGEEAGLSEVRALLGASEKALADVAQAQEALDADGLSSRLGQAYRALERARDRVQQSGAASGTPVVKTLEAALEALDRTLVESAEAGSAVDAAAEAFEFEPDQLEKAEERLFALRAAARRLNVGVEDLPHERVRLAQALRAEESLGEALAHAETGLQAALAAYRTAAAALSEARTVAAARLADVVNGELAPLKLEKARFRVALQPLSEDRAGAAGGESVEFQVATNPGAPFGALGAIASGGELARFALALKAALAGPAATGREGPGPTMIFDEVDQGVGGAVADAVGLRLKRLSRDGQVVLVTHSPQIAARADTHWRVAKASSGEELTTSVSDLEAPDREEEIARMLAGAEITDAARAAARALMHA